ncbi:MAG: hypothetical protein MJE12_02955 [Alphaproteobacteria bacterium]|nr:hypothetical protein [Alphaproteobacteria bacterium]
MTAAEAKQRGFESVLVEDAVGHVHSAHRTPVFDWLMSMYALSVLRAAEVSLR